MTIKVNLPTGHTLNFPDGTSEADIQAMIAQIGKTPEEAASRAVTESAPGRFGAGVNRAVNPLAAPRKSSGMVESVASGIDTAADWVSQHAGIAGPGYKALGSVLSTPIREVGGAIAEGDLAGAGGYIAGSVIPALTTEGAEAGLAALLEKSAQTSWGRVLNATTKPMKAKSARVIPELIERGEMAATLPRLQKKVAGEVGSAGAAVKATEAAIVKAGGQTNIDPIFDALEQFKNQKTFIKGTNIAMRPKLRSAIEEIQDRLVLLAPLGNPASRKTLVPTEQIIDLKRILQESVDDSGGFFGKSVKANSTLKAEKVAQKFIRQELDKAYPDLAEVNRTFHFWKNVDEVLGATASRRMGQKVPLTEALVGTAAAGGGLAHGGAIEGLLAGAAGATLVKLMTSTGYRTVSAVTKDRLASALASGNISKAVAILTPAIQAGKQR